jgi:deoxyribose-phosphate aldolase
MIYKEFCCYTQNFKTTIEDYQKGIVTALQCGFNGINVHHFLLSHVKDLIPEGIVLSVPIDYPNGISDPQVQEHEIIKSANSGANAIDFVLNNYLVQQARFDALIKDLKSKIDICKDRKLSLRIMLDYRLYNNLELNLIGKILSTTGIEYVFPSTGLEKEDVVDNIIAAKELKDCGLNVICNGNIWLEKHIQLIKNTNLFGVRIHSPFTITNLLKCVLKN